MNVQTILDLINGGVAVYKSVDQALGAAIPPQAQVVLTAGVTIVETAEKLFVAIQGDLTATDQAGVDAALSAAKIQCGMDLDRVLGEIAADKGK